MISSLSLRWDRLEVDISGSALPPPGPEREFSGILDRILHYPHIYTISRLPDMLTLMTLIVVAGTIQ